MKAFMGLLMCMCSGMILSHNPCGSSNPPASFITISLSPTMTCRCDTPELGGLGVAPPEWGGLGAAWSPRCRVGTTEGGGWSVIRCCIAYWRERRESSTCLGSMFWRAFILYGETSNPGPSSFTWKPFIGPQIRNFSGPVFKFHTFLILYVNFCKTILAWNSFNPI